ncbi:MAG: hypothetical protein ACREA9_29035 [Pyrinomonadaceae bacterium]
MAEEQKSRKGMLAAGVAIILALLFLVLAKAKAAARAGTPAQPQPEKKPEIFAIPSESPEAEAAAAGSFEVLEVSRTITGGTRGFTMINPDNGPHDGEAWVVEGFTAFSTDGNSQGFDGALVSVEQARVINRTGLGTAVSATLIALNPTWIKLFPSSGVGNNNQFDFFNDQTARGATAMRYPRFIIPPNYVFVIVEINNIVAGADHVLGFRIMFRRVLAAGSQSSAQRSGGFTGGLGRWISSLTS